MKYPKICSLLISVAALSPPALAVPPAPQAIGPYSPVVTADNLVFLSGQIAIDPATGKLDSGLSIEAQTELVWANIRSILQHEGLDLENVVQAQVYLIDMADFQRMNAAYAAALGAARPARTTVAVSALPLGARIEIAVTASRRR